MSIFYKGYMGNQSVMSKQNLLDFDTDMTKKLERNQYVDHAILEMPTGFIGWSDIKTSGKKILSVDLY